MGKIAQNCKIIGANSSFESLRGQIDEEFTLVNVNDSIHDFTFLNQKYLFDIKGCIFTKENTIVLMGFLSDDKQEVGKIALELFS